MGKAARRHRRDLGDHGDSSAPGKAKPGKRETSPRERAEAALLRLVKSNPPGKVSLAGAYALGYSALGLAQLEGEETRTRPAGNVVLGRRLAAEISRFL